MAPTVNDGAATMDTGFEFEGCLHACTGLAEALDAAGVGCHVPGPAGEDEGSDEPD